MKPTKLTFFQWNWQVLFDSIKKINLNIALIAILDFIFYFLSISIAGLWLQRLMEKAASFRLPSDINSIGLEEAQQLAKELSSFYYLIILSFILIIVAVILLASVFKGIIWARTTMTKISFRLLSKFFRLNLVWMGFWFLLFIAVAVLIDPSSAGTGTIQRMLARTIVLLPLSYLSSKIILFATLTIALGVYFTNTLYTVFMAEQRLGSIFKAVRLSITKIHLFLLPYFIISAVFLLLIWLLSLLNFRYSSVIYIVVLLLFAAFIRYYISTLVLAIEKKAK